MMYLMAKTVFIKRTKIIYSNNQRMKEDGKNSIMVDIFLTTRNQTTSKLRELPTL
jgi:hypothetical protein